MMNSIEPLYHTCIRNINNIIIIIPASVRRCVGSSSINDGWKMLGKLHEVTANYAELYETSTRMKPPKTPYIHNTIMIMII